MDFIDAGKIGAIILGGILAIGLIFSIVCLERVPAGYEDCQLSTVNY